MDDLVPTHSIETELDLLLRASHGRPVIQIVLDPERDVTTIQGAGIDEASIPRIIIALGRALTDEG
jgi:hypothetical protein